MDNAFVDAKLHVNAFDHPAVIVSMPNPASEVSVVEIAIVSLSGFGLWWTESLLPDVEFSFPSAC